MYHAAVSAHLAAAAAGTSILNTAGIIGLLTAILVIGVLTVAIRAMLHAHRSNVAGVLTAMVIVGGAAMIWSLATTNGAIPALGHDLVKAFLKI